MLAHFVRVLVQCAPGSAAGSAPARGACTALAVQLLQSLSILTANTRRETSIYYLFSNNYLNDLLALKQFDYGVDEEVLAWYISFLKAISLQLNEHTIQFFVGDAATPADGAPGVPAAFPLYAQVIRFVQHGDSMVRAAARAATLNVFRVDDPAVRGPARGWRGRSRRVVRMQAAAGA
jgi:protein CLEC16A